MAQYAACAEGIEEFRMTIIAIFEVPKNGFETVEITDIQRLGDAFL